MQTPLQPVRRQLTLWLPETQRLVVESIRLRIDPSQHALIPAHVTLCRDDELPDLGDLRKRLDGLGRFSLTLKFGGPEVLPDGCVLLRPKSGVEEFQALRKAILGPSSPSYGPHLTLLHPRNAQGASYELAAITRELQGLSISFRTIALIEQHGSSPWQVQREYPAAIEARP
jgi:hypothetical protein